MTTMPRTSYPKQSRCSFFIFLVLFSLCGTGAHLSWGQGSVRDPGPALLRDSLKPQMETLPPFLRDTQVGLNLRLYYFNRDNDVTPPQSDNEAFAIGGSLAYQSGFLADIFRVGVEGFTSLKLHGPESRDGTLLLLPGQESYAALGRAYGELQYHVYTATLYRQYIDTPYVNPQDNRITQHVRGVPHDCEV